MLRPSDPCVEPRWSVGVEAPAVRLPESIRYTRPTMTRPIASALLVALALSACGLKGPLYLPDNPPPAEKAAQDRKK
jgi:predicted small lipoprotein YifL